MSRSKRGKSNNDEFTNEQQSQLEAALQKESQLIDINASRRNEEQFIKFWNQIAKAVKGKGAAQCLNRYQKIRNNLKQFKSPKTTGPVVPSQILKKSSNDTSKKIKSTKSTKSTKTTKTTVTKTTKAQPKAKVQTNKPVTTKSAVKIISSNSIAKPEPETKVPTPRKVASTPTPSAPIPVQSISTASTPTAPKPTPAALPFPTKPPSPWNQLEHHQLESAIKETRTMQDKRERWKLIGTKVSTRSARECLAKFKEMREALLANK